MKAALKIGFQRGKEVCTAVETLLCQTGCQRVPMYQVGFQEDREVPMLFDLSEPAPRTCSWQKCAEM